MLLSSPGAQAGSWVFTCKGNGVNTVDYGYPGVFPTFTFWTPPGPQTGSFNLSKFGGGSDYAVSDVATITVTVTATWTHTTGQTDTNDPAPPSVWLCESAGTEWTEGASGSSSDGLGDPYKLQLPGGTSNSSFAPITLPPAHWASYPVSGGKATLPARTLTGEGDFASSQSFPYGGNCYAYVDSYSVTVHPQPYNMHLSSYGTNPVYPAVTVDNIGGQLFFYYSISSTDGNTHNLTSITAYETLDWGSNNPGIYQNGMYIHPSPPVAPYPDGVYYAYSAMDKVVFPYLLDGYVRDGLSPPGKGFVAPYPSPPTVWSVTQNYLFDDSATGQVKVKIPGPDNNSPFTITRSVAPTNASGTTGIYAISTRGYSALKSLP